MPILYDSTGSLGALDAGVGRGFAAGGLMSMNPVVRIGWKNRSIHRHGASFKSRPLALYSRYEDV
jgi:hypothetical protein